MFEAERGRSKREKGIRKKTSSQKGISEKLRGFADKIAATKVLDPACGSGNFLYVALRLLLDLLFEYVKQHVYPERVKNRRTAYAQKWWQYAEARPGMRAKLKDKHRFIATPRVAKHRIFTSVQGNVLSNDGTIVFALEDDYYFGILHSKLHETWALKQGTSLEDRPRYTPTTTFETFPFPWPPSKEPKDNPRVQAIAQAAKELVEQRDRWLNADLTPHPSPRRRGEQSMLTNLYNQRPTWLGLAHKRLDEAVFVAYGWKSDLSDEEILERLLALNLKRSKAAV